MAQPIESQVNGVDKMLYMKSTSGNDGSYSLSVSFEVGTRSGPEHGQRPEPRPASPCPSCRRRCSASGVTVTKASSALLQVVASIRPSGTLDPLFLSQLRHDQHHRRAEARPRRRRRAPCSARSTTRCGSGMNPQRLTSTRADADRYHQRDPVAEHAGRGRPHRRRARLTGDQQFQLTIRPRAGSPTPRSSRASSCAPTRTAVVRVRDVARVELGAKALQDRFDLQWQARGRHRHLPVARAPTPSQSPSGSATLDRAQDARSREDLAYEIIYDTTDLREGHASTRSSRRWSRPSSWCGIVVFVFLGSCGRP